MGKVSDTRTAYRFAFEADGERVVNGDGRVGHVTITADSEAEAWRRIATYTHDGERAVFVETLEVPA